MRRRLVWGAALLGLWAAADRAAAQTINPAAISRGYSGFGFAPAVGTITRGASYSGYGYVFVPGVGFQLPSVYAPPYMITSPATRPAPRQPPAKVTFLVPGHASLFVEGDGPYLAFQGFVRTYLVYPRQKGEPHSVEALARWTEGGKVVESRRTVKVRSGESVRIDLRKPGP